MRPFARGFKWTVGECCRDRILDAKRGLPHIAASD